MGKSSFLIKGLYLVLIIIIIAFVVNQIVSLRISSSKQEANLELREKANNILDNLAGNENCLAYKEQVTIENKNVKLASHKILDKEKLDYFVENYFDIEPECAQDFTYGYRVEVETFPVAISTTGVERGGKTPDELLRIISGKKVIFTIDISGSMAEDPIDNCDEYTPKRKKGCCLKKWLIGLLDKMDDDSKVSIIPYGWSPGDASCTKEKISALVTLAGNRDNLKQKVENYPIVPGRGTPMCAALEQSFIYGKKADADIIVLLTDGSENCCCKNRRCPATAPKIYDSSVECAEEHKNSGIIVHTVGFGTSNVDDKTLQKVADLTNGKYFKAETCEELVSDPKEKISVSIKEMHWSFGDLSFSEKEALNEINTVSVPIIVYVNKSTFLPGSMEITLVRGELERFVGFVESSCFTEQDSNLEMYLHYPIELEEKEDGKYICMQIENETKCQRLICDKEIEFNGIQRAGNYKFYSKFENNKLKIVV